MLLRMKVFKDVPAFICHYHFLKALGKELFGEEREIIGKTIEQTRDPGEHKKEDLLSGK